MIDTLTKLHEHIRQTRLRSCRRVDRIEILGKRRRRRGEMEKEEERKRWRTEKRYYETLPTLMKCRESPHGVYYISPLMTEHM